MERSHRPELTTIGHAIDRLRAGRRAVAAVVVGIEGSAPLPLGATMVVDEDGGIEGSVTGGCVESAVVQEAEAILRDGAPARVATYGISDELAGTVGLTCGGTVHVFVAAVPAAALPALEAFHAATAAGEPTGIATLLDGPRAGARLVVARGEQVGSLGEAELLDRNVAADLRGLIDHGRSTTRAYGRDGSRLGADQRVFFLVHAAAPRLVIVGAIDFSAALAPIAAQLGYRVTIVDPRRAFASSPRFSRHAEVVVGWPQEALAKMPLGQRDAVLVFSHDPKIDEPAVRAALATDAGYIGALGSRRTTADRSERLRAAGVSDEELARVHAPCGLDIGGSTAEETAISVLAELIAHRTGRSGRPLRFSSGPIRATADDAAVSA